MGSDAVFEDSIDLVIFVDRSTCRFIISGALLLFCDIMFVAIL